MYVCMYVYIHVIAGCQESRGGGRVPKGPRGQRERGESGRGREGGSEGVREREREREREKFWKECYTLC